MSKERYTRNYLLHDDGMYFAPLPEPGTFTEQIPEPIRSLEYDGTEQSFAKICEIIRGQAVKSVSAKG